MLHWNRKNCCRSLTALALLVCVGAARAADVPESKPGFSLGGRAAYFDSKQAGAEGTWFGGAQARWHFDDVWAAEGSIDYRHENHGGGVESHVYPVMASLLAYIVPDKSPVSPFLLGGFGWYYTNTTGPNGYDSRQNRWGPHAGAGLEFFLNDHWSLDGTWRYTWLSDIDGPQNVSPSSVDGAGWMATGGINYRF